MARLGVAWQGAARQGKAGGARQGMARLGKAGQAIERKGAYVDRADTIAQWVKNDTLPELKGVHLGFATLDALDLTISHAVYMHDMGVAQELVTMYVDIVLLRVTC